MHVGDHQNFCHQFSRSSPKCVMIISATSDLLISGKASSFAFGNRSVTRLVSTLNPASGAEMSLATSISNFLDFNLRDAFSIRFLLSAANPITTRAFLDFLCGPYLDDPCTYGTG